MDAVQINLDGLQNKMVEGQLKSVVQTSVALQSSEHCKGKKSLQIKTKIKTESAKHSKKAKTIIQVTRKYISPLVSLLNKLG